jgi:hypothetical protein
MATKGVSTAFGKAVVTARYQNGEVNCAVGIDLKQLTPASSATPLVSATQPIQPSADSDSRSESVTGKRAARHKSEKAHKSSVPSQLPPGAILVLTFEEDTLRRENGKLVTVADLSGKGHAVTVHDAVVVEGRVGKGLEFGDGRYVEVQGPFLTGNQPRTFAVWMKATERHARYAFMQGPDRPHEGFGIAAPNIWKFLSSSGDRLATTARVDADWHHHAVTYDRAQVCYYYDARVVLAAHIDLHTAAGPLILGGGASKGNNFKGVIDEVAVFDRALSEYEVQQLYQMGKSGHPLASPR